MYLVYDFHNKYIGLGLVLVLRNIQQFTVYMVSYMTVTATSPAHPQILYAANSPGYQHYVVHGTNTGTGSPHTIHCTQYCLLC